MRSLSSAPERRNAWPGQLSEVELIISLRLTEIKKHGLLHSAPCTLFGCLPHQGVNSDEEVELFSRTQQVTESGEV